MNKIFEFKFNFSAYYCYLSILLIFQCISLSSEREIEDLSYQDTNDVEIGNAEMFKQFESLSVKEYQIGAGDKIELVVPGLDSLSKEYLVSPDGTITIHPLGEIKISNMSRTTAQLEVVQKLKKYYIIDSLTLRILTFENNRISILGDITKPGVIPFDSRPTLLEALSKAGLIYGKERSRNSRLAIFRGDNAVLWIELNELLVKGNTNLNVVLSNKDILYIPGADEFNVYILGEVEQPGAYSLGTGTNLIKAIQYAGGTTENALLSEIKLIRKKRDKLQGGEVTIDLENVLDDSDFSQNYALKNNDIVFVPKRGVAKFNYYLRMLNPFAQLFIVGSAVKSSSK